MLKTILTCAVKAEGEEEWGPGQSADTQSSVEADILLPSNLPSIPRRERDLHANLLLASQTLPLVYVHLNAWVSFLEEVGLSWALPEAPQRSREASGAGLSEPWADTKNLVY
jgi:hypothetical protein